MMGCRTDGAAARLSNVKNAQSMGVAFLTTIESLGGEVMGEDNVTIFHKQLGEMGGDEEVSLEVLGWGWGGVGVELVGGWCGVGLGLVWVWCGVGVELVYGWCGVGVGLV